MRKNKDKVSKVKMRDENKGITLVALVITIVILIILAMVAINAVFGDSGLLQYAQDARNYQANADASDGELINSATEYIDGIIGGNSGGDEPTEPSGPSTVAEAKEIGETFEDTTTIKDDLENDVTIPGGFNIAEDSGTKVEEGIVIEDEIGNQFVWIPVGIYETTSGEKTNNLSRRSWLDEEGISAVEIEGDEAILTNFYGEGDNRSIAYTTIDTFKTSAINNKGFYIGRYEQSENNVCKAKMNAFTNITRDEAIAKSEELYGTENEFVKSELISSYAWDTALNFICQNNNEGYLLATTNDSVYGNIGTNKEELTGEYEADDYCNIHDLLGNCFEWTTEYFDGSDIHLVSRGGRIYL